MFSFLGKVEVQGQLFSILRWQQGACPYEDRDLLQGYSDGDISGSVIKLVVPEAVPAAGRQPYHPLLHTGVHNWCDKQVVAQEELILDSPGGGVLRTQPEEWPQEGQPGLRAFPR